MVDVELSKNLRRGVVKMKRTNKMMSFTMLFFMLANIILSPIGSIVHAQGNPGSQYDITLTAATPTVSAGDTGILEMHVKLAGSQESINEDLSGKARVTVQLPADSEYYTVDEDELAKLSIQGTVPTYDSDNKTLTWALTDIATGISE